MNAAKMAPSSSPDVGWPKGQVVGSGGGQDVVYQLPTGACVSEKMAEVRLVRLVAATAAKVPLARRLLAEPLDAHEERRNDQ